MGSEINSSVYCECLIIFEAYKVIKSTSGQKILKAFDMDPEAFLDLANQVAKVKMYPYFDLAHAVVCCLIIKEDMGSGAIAFSRKHPLALWFSSMMSIFAGSIIANFLLGEPSLTPFK